MAVTGWRDFCLALSSEYHISVDTCKRTLKVKSTYMRVRSSPDSKVRKYLGGGVFRVGVGDLPGCWIGSVL